MKKLLKIVLIKTLPVLAGYLVLGFGFGLLLSAQGYGVLWAIAMSITMYAGAMQYVAVDLIGSGASLISTAIMTLLVNARHIFYGISLLDKYTCKGFKKFYMMFALTDETYSLVCGDRLPEGVNKDTYYFMISLMNHIYWIIGGAIGAGVGTLFDFNTAGVEFAMTALFISIFVEQWLSTKNHISALIGVFSSVICLLIFGAENFLIPTMVVIVAAMALLRNVIEKGEARNG